MPLIDKEGIKADFRFVKVDGLERESRERAAAFLYEDARNSLAQAKEGDKMAARNGYLQMEKIAQKLKLKHHKTQLAFNLSAVKNNARYPASK